MQDRDTILTINVVEPQLVRAVGLHSQKLGKDLKGLALVDEDYANFPDRPKDDTGLFKEVVCDFNNLDSIQSAIKPYSDRLLAATCRYEEAMQGFGKVIPFLPYIHTPSPESLEWATEKPLMRDRLRNYDTNLVPKYQYMETQDLPNFHKLIEGFQYPLIIKPAGLSKALLVTRNNNEAELKNNLENTFKIIQQIYDNQKYPGRPGVLVEEMMQGDMYSVDAYVTHDGQIFCLPLVKVITAHSQGLPGFYGYHQQTPVELPAEEIDAAKEACKSAIKAVNLSSTTAHIELFRTPNGWKIIEIAGRIGGYRDFLYREAYGLEHFYNDLSIRMGKLPEVPTKPISNAALIKFYAENEGRITSIQGLDTGAMLSSVVYSKMHTKPGEVALFAGNGGDHVIEIGLSNKNSEQLKSDIAKLRELVKIEVEQTVEEPEYAGNSSF